jgi:hypothetical protein
LISTRNFISSVLKGRKDYGMIARIFLALVIGLELMRVHQFELPT